MSALSAQSGFARLGAGMPVGVRQQVPLAGTVRRKRVPQSDGEVGLPGLITMGIVSGQRVPVGWCINCPRTCGRR